VREPRLSDVKKEANPLLGYEASQACRINANFDQDVKICKLPTPSESGRHKPATLTRTRAALTWLSNFVASMPGETHEVPNLWMAGPCGASNPTYTIFTTAPCGADHVAAF